MIASPLRTDICVSVRSGRYVGGVTEGRGIVEKSVLIHYTKNHKWNG